MNIQHPLKLSSAEFNHNPHPYFAWMRQNQPVYTASIGFRKPAILLTRYEDVEAFITDESRQMKDPNTNKANGGSAGMWLPKSFQPLLHNMLNSDEPDHRRLRNLVHKAFTPRMIRTLAPRIEQIAHDLLEQAACKPQIDLIRDYALPLPIIVIAEMLGIPPADLPMFRGYVERIMVNPKPLNMIKAIPAIRGFLRYTRKLADERRRDPREDVISGLALAEEDGDKLSEDELVGTVFLLLTAGHETTVGLISNGVRALVEHPKQLTKLRANPDLIDSAIEEIVRFDGPLQTTEFAFARRPFSLHGIDIAAGAMVLPAILSANRDETAFNNPNVFDIERTPNKHLGFGKGIHYCLGAPLARLETRTALCALLQHAPDLRITVPTSKLTYSNMPLVNRMSSLPVAF